MSPSTNPYGGYALTRVERAWGADGGFWFQGVLAHDGAAIASVGGGRGSPYLCCALSADDEREVAVFLEYARRWAKERGFCIGDTGMFVNQLLAVHQVDRLIEDARFTYDDVGS